MNEDYSTIAGTASSCEVPCGINDAAGVLFHKPFNAKHQVVLLCIISYVHQDVNDSIYVCTYIRMYIIFNIHIHYIAIFYMFILCTPLLYNLAYVSYQLIGRKGMQPNFWQAKYLIRRTYNTYVAAIQ